MMWRMANSIPDDCVSTDDGCKAKDYSFMMTRQLPEIYTSNFSQAIEAPPLTRGMNALCGCPFQEIETLKRVCSAGDSPQLLNAGIGLWR